MRIRAKNGEPKRWLDTVAMAYEGDDCLIFPYGKSYSGYGAVYIDGKMCPVHRYICEAAYGPPFLGAAAAHSRPDGTSCIHHACVNKKHLRWATSKENTADRIAHGRNFSGERHPGVKLTLGDVAHIRKSDKSLRVLAAEFRISIMQVSRIKRNLRWIGVAT